MRTPPLDSAPNRCARNAQLCASEDIAPAMSNAADAAHSVRRAHRFHKGVEARIHRNPLPVAKKKRMTRRTQPLPPRNDQVTLTKILATHRPRMLPQAHNTIRIANRPSGSGAVYAAWSWSSLFRFGAGLGGDLRGVGQWGGVWGHGGAALGHGHAAMGRPCSRLQLQASVTKSHSSSILSRPRKEKRAKPRTALTTPNTGSTVRLRRRDTTRPAMLSSSGAASRRQGALGCRTGLAGHCGRKSWGRLRPSADTDTRAAMPRLASAATSAPLGSRRRSRLVKACAQRLPTRNLFRQFVPRIRRRGVSRLRARQQRRNLRPKLRRQLASAVVAHRTATVRSRIQLAAIDADNANLRQVLPTERRYRVMVRCGGSPPHNEHRCRAASRARSGGSKILFV